MADSRTIRILSLDGGGERGYITIKFLQKFIQQWGINQADLWKNFDVICGTSVGGILALAFALGKTPDELESFFTEQGPYLFSTNGLPSDKASTPTKLIRIALGDPFYPAGDVTYGADVLTSSLNTVFGTNTLQDVKTNVLIPSYQYDTSTYVLFSNTNYAEFMGQNELITNVSLATSAAPLYLPSAEFGGHTYIDGGVYQNNPAEFGRALGQMLKPTANRCCVLSVGTGIGDMGFESASPSLNAIDPIEILFKLFSIACTGGQESVAKALALESQYTLTQLYNYRFQPYLDPTRDTELDTTDPDTLDYYADTVNSVFNADIDDINNFIGHLTA